MTTLFMPCVHLYIDMLFNFGYGIGNRTVAPLLFLFTRTNS